MDCPNRLKNIFTKYVITLAPMGFWSVWAGVQNDNSEDHNIPFLRRIDQINDNLCLISKINSKGRVALRIKYLRD